MAARYIIELKDAKRRKFWEKLLKELPFIKVEQTSEHEPLKLTAKERKFQEGLRRSIKEMKDDLSGKRKLQSARSFVDELRS